MSDGSKIEWCDASWNPIRARRLAGGKVGWHCEKVSAGCANCYAERFNGRGLPNGGTGLRYNQVDRELVETFVDEQEIKRPGRWRTPRRIFVCSMTDMFGDWVTDEQIDKVFAVMAFESRHQFMVLTKRARRMRAYLESRSMSITHWEAAARSMGLSLRYEHDGKQIGLVWFPLRNVRLGVSVEDQATADERIPELLATPAALRFVSYEPAIGPVDFRRFMWPVHPQWPAKYATPEAAAADGAKVTLNRQALVLADAAFLRWIIVGGESGPGARPFDVAWARSTIAQCKAAGSACFLKQLGAMPIWNGCGLVANNPPGPTFKDVVGGSEVMFLKLKSRKGGDPSEWPVDLRVREFPA